MLGVVLCLNCSHRTRGTGRPHFVSSDVDRIEIDLLGRDRLRRKHERESRGERRGKWRGPTEAERFATGRDGPRTIATCRKCAVDVSHVRERGFSHRARFRVPSLFDICVYRLLQFISRTRFALSPSFRAHYIGF